MKVEMSATAIENRLRLVGELTKACLLVRQRSSEKINAKSAADKSNSDLNPKSVDKKHK